MSNINNISRVTRPSDVPAQSKSTTKTSPSDTSFKLLLQNELLKQQNAQNPQTTTTIQSFGNVGELQSSLIKHEEVSELSFSKHATERLLQRGIELTEDLLGTLTTALEKARTKGARDVVIIDSSGAFIVNVPNNLVVTAMSPGDMKNNIFTNIDAAILT